jgi:hypothetical protein
MNSLRDVKAIALIVTTIVAAAVNVALELFVFIPDSWPPAIIGGLTVVGLLLLGSRYSRSTGSQ